MNYYSKKAEWKPKAGTFQWAWRAQLSSTAGRENGSLSKYREQYRTLGRRVTDTVTSNWQKGRMW